MVVEILKVRAGVGPTQSQIEKIAAAAFKLKRRSLFSYIPLRRAAEMVETIPEVLEEFAHTNTKKVHALRLTSGNMVFHPDSFLTYVKAHVERKILREFKADHILESPLKRG